MAEQYFTVEHLTVKQIASIFSRIHVSAESSHQGTSCWEWQGVINVGGYGHATWNRRPIRVHRLMYAWLVEPLPRCYRAKTDLEIDHLCRNRRCCHPAHLELVPKSVNMKRVDWKASGNGAKTHCKQGHEFTPENTILYSNGKARHCRTCYIHSQRKTYHKLRQDPDYVAKEQMRRRSRYLQHEKPRYQWKRPEGPRKGEDAYSAKLTESDVRQIRALNASGICYAELARRWNISDTAIKRVVMRRTWRHVD